jgi:hypothetical protein
MLQNKDVIVEEFFKIFQSLYSKFREFDIIRDSDLKAAISKFLLDEKDEAMRRAEGISDTILMTYLNCCSFAQIKEEFDRFVMDFDDNLDGRLQVHELELCLETLGKDLGKAKVRIGLVEMGVEVDVGVSFLKEGSESKKLIDKQISGQLRELFVVKEERVVNGVVTRAKRLDYIETSLLLPYLFAFWMEYQVKKVLASHKVYDEVKGLPLLQQPDGLSHYNPQGEPKGLLLALLMQFDEKPELRKKCVNFNHVVRALKSFRTLGFIVKSS